MVNRLEVKHRGGHEVTSPSVEMAWALCSTLATCVHKVMKVANDNMAKVRKEHDEGHRVDEKQKLKLPKGVLCHSSQSLQKVSSIPSPFMLRV